MILQFSSDDSPTTVANRTFPQLFRIDFSGCGFALVQFQNQLTSCSQRKFMIDLRDELTKLLIENRGKKVAIQSLSRFDQQTTTKFHLDGGPEESVLMLGYEPTRVKSAVALADYSRAAQDLGITPIEFLNQYNPMFVAGERLLEPYIHRLTQFDESRFQILLINNSRTEIRPGTLHSLGVLHQASILNPDPTQSRVINSMMLGVCSSVASDNVSPDEVADFIQTDVIARGIYSHN